MVGSADANSLLNGADDAEVALSGLVGLTGLEPVTLRLSSACSNQLSYRPDYAKVSPSKPALK